MKGMKFPIRVDAYGGAETIEGYPVIDQNVILAVRPAGSLNPWNQKLTPDEDLIFDIRDVRTGGLYSIHVRQFFDEMERAGFAKLLSGSRGISFDISDEAGNMDVTIRYVNLERNKDTIIKFPIRGDRG